MNCLCSHSSAMCGHDPECPDLLCPGRPVTLHRVPGLSTNDGGHSFHSGVVFPIEPEQLDEPIATPETCGLWAVAAQVFLAAITVACIAGVVIAYLKT